MASVAIVQPQTPEGGSSPFSIRPDFMQHPTAQLRARMDRPFSLADDPSALSYSLDPLDPRHQLVMALADKGYAPQIYAKAGAGFSSAGKDPHENGVIFTGSAEVYYKRLRSSGEYEALLKAYNPAGEIEELFEKRLRESQFFNNQSHHQARALVRWLYLTQKYDRRPNPALEAHETYLTYFNGLPTRAKGQLLQAGLNHSPTEQEFRRIVIDPLLENIPKLRH